MPWDLALQSFFNLAISFMNPAGYWKFYPVPVLVEHAHVKEREHEKHVVQTAKSAMCLNPGTEVPRRTKYPLHVQDVSSRPISSLVRPLKYCDASSQIRLNETTTYHTPVSTTKAATVWSAGVASSSAS